MLLKRIVQEQRAAFYDEAEDWRDAVEKSCLRLVETGAVEADYGQHIIRCVEEYGPYILIAPGIAMPHVNGENGVAKESAIAFTRFRKSVIFDPEDPDSRAHLFFTLAAADPNTHLENIQALCILLENEDLVQRLLQAESPADLLSIAEEIK